MAGVEDPGGPLARDHRQPDDLLRLRPLVVHAAPEVQLVHRPAAKPGPLQHQGRPWQDGIGQQAPDGRRGRRAQLRQHHLLGAAPRHRQQRRGGRRRAHHLHTLTLLLRSSFTLTHLYLCPVRQPLSEVQDCKQIQCLPRLVNRLSATGTHTDPVGHLPENPPELEQSEMLQ